MTTIYYIGAEQSEAARQFHRGMIALADFRENADDLTEDVRLCNRHKWWEKGEPPCVSPAGERRMCAYVEVTLPEDEHFERNKCRCCTGCRDRCYDEA